MLEKNNGMWYYRNKGGYVYWYELDAFEFIRVLGRSIKAIIDAVVVVARMLCIYVYLNWAYIILVIYGSVILLTISLCITHQLPQPNWPGWNGIV
jgi:hypothetical protein